ncbi:hypothetical protein ACH4E7_43520 [Kitasatospora sp. NPDC018058]|uniref:hypothetical protein n=1 Tax=Kitasatospora sp. NPDC018058 TaxID=3364025 RepID=UPI0037C02DC3
MEKIIPTEKPSATLLWPVTGLATGTPVLIRKLTAPQRERRAEAAALKAQQAELATKAAESAESAFAKKLAAEPDATKRAAMIQARETAQVTARQIELDQAKAARKAKLGRAGDAAGAAALMLIVGGPLIWSLARPWVQPAIGLLIGAWWIAALIHAPAPGKAAPAGDEQAPAADPDGTPEGGADNTHEDAPEDAKAGDPDPSPADLARSAGRLRLWVEGEVFAAKAEGRPGVHLSQLVTAYREQGGQAPVDEDLFAARLAALGVPVGPLTLGPKTARINRRGVRFDQLSTALGREPHRPPRLALDNTPA